MSRMSNQDLPEELRGILPDVCYAECISFDVDAGWHSLLKDLLVFIAERNPDIRVHQVKEKFGGLRFYIYGGNEEMRGAIRMAEAMSHKICENCGVPGHKQPGGWIRTLCDPCQEKHLTRKLNTDEILNKIKST